MLAPAKINLMLHVTGKREDGYHLLQSLVCFANIGDTITLTPTDDFSLTITGEFAENLQGDNLITQAANALASAHNITPHGHLTLTKNLPIGAGLGGGSSDAAIALKLLAKYWNCTIPSFLPASLGSDIPACLAAMPCWMEGTGESITPLIMDFALPILIVNPRIEVSTPSVYQRVTQPYSAPMSLPQSFTTSAELLTFLKATHNALEAPAISLEPAISVVLEAIGALPGCELSRMSGSGSTCFGIFGSQEACESAKNALEAQHPHWWVRSTTLRSSHE